MTLHCCPDLLRGVRFQPVQLLLVLLSALALSSHGQANAADLSPAAQVDVIHAAADLIEARYVDADRAREIAKTLRESDDRWRQPLDAEAFADKATTFFREVSRDGHLGLSYSAEVIPEEQGEASFSAAEMERWYGPRINHGVERIERLPDNIMLLDLRVFPPPEMAGDVISAAMTVVAQADALIIDLRRNGGGSDTGRLLMGYLLEPGSPLSGTYNRPADTHTHASSPVWVPGRRYGSSRPLYILTSSRTFSAAEAVAYDLQALGRAVVVGEVTGGGAHPFEYRRVHPHFAVDLPEGKSINPVTGTNWQDVGVEPDVKVPAAEALEKALALARAKLGLGGADGS